jgi:hypothetical protein
MEADSRLFLLVLALAIFACGGVQPLTGATVTPTGQIGAVEIGTPGLKGNKKNFQIWTGTITSRTSRQYMSNGAVVNTCNTNWLTDLEFAVDATGEVAGTGQAMLAEPRDCSPRADLVANAAEMAISIQGWKDSSGFHLNLTGSESKPSPSADFGGYVLLLHDGVCPPKSRTIAVPLMVASSAEAQINLSGVLTGCGGSKDDTMNNRSLVKLEFRFKCSDIPADQGDTALEKLCQ